jgi:hypothetical protein
MDMAGAETFGWRNTLRWVGISGTAIAQRFDRVRDLGRRTNLTVARLAVAHPLACAMAADQAASLIASKGAGNCRWTAIRHCERSAAIHGFMDCRATLAMTAMALQWPRGWCPYCMDCRATLAMTAMVCNSATTPTQLAATIGARHHVGLHHKGDYGTLCHEVCG